LDNLLIDGNKFDNEGEIHQYLKEKLEFPNYYGMNFSALWDCLTGWVEYPLTITWINYDVTLEKMGHIAELFLSIFRSAERKLGHDDFKFILNYNQKAIAPVKRSKLRIDGEKFGRASDLYHYVVDQLNLTDHYWANPDRFWESLSEKYDLPATIEWINFEESRRKLGKEADEILKVLKEAEAILKSFKVEVQ
jgi:ribonuclease inhibitor